MTLCCLQKRYSFIILLRIDMRVLTMLLMQLTHQRSNFFIVGGGEGGEPVSDLARHHDAVANIGPKTRSLAVCF